MDATERAIANRNGGARPTTAAQLRRKGATNMAATKSTAKKTTARKPAAAKKATPAKDAPKRTNVRNVDQTCSVKGCSHPAVRRGFCSGKGSNRHYRAALAKEKAAAK